MDLFAAIFSSFTHWTWWIAGTVMVLAEVFVGGAFLLWLGIAAFVVGGLLFLGVPLSWEWQLTVFSLVTVVSLLLWRKLYKKKTEKSDDELLSRRADKYIGQSFIVAEAIKNGVGKVQVEDTLWRALGEDAPKGASVTVVSIEGASFKVKLTS